MITTLELDSLLTSLIPCYNGTFAINELPPEEKISRPSCLISNTDVASLPGTHWMGICFPPQKHLIYFIDPYDLPLHKILPHLYNWLKKFSSQIISLPFAIQPLQSKLCGAYCAFILYHLPSFNYELNSLIFHYFNRDELEQNDLLISKWWYKSKNNKQ